MMQLIDAKTIFWDFDGVIKDSVNVKSDAFEMLFLPFGKDLSKRVRKHHEKNGGISRFDKLPLYLSWSYKLKSPSRNQVNEYATRFSQLVKEKVVQSMWVDGVLDYLINNHKSQQFFLITATPQQEIEEILTQLDIYDYFEKIIGSPNSKSEAIEILLLQYNVSLESAIMIGDTISDYEAASFNNVPFILRKTKLNNKLQDELNCSMIKDFL